MFGHRSDGKKVKGMAIIDKAEPFFMPMRIDAVNYTTVDILCASIDDFIAKERRNGKSYNYMHVIFTALVKILYARPKLNRFIMRGSIYQRNGIMVSMDIKKKLADEGESVTLKFHFTGRENIEDVKAIMDKQINENLKQDSVYSTTKVAGKLGKMPDFMFRWAMALIRWMDKHGMLPKGLIEASPFHTSAFVTNLKSIKLGHIYHHLYNFGTTSIFMSMGKEKMMPVVENNKELKIAKVMQLGMSLDERIADGYYMGKSFRLLHEILENPESLTERMPDDGSIPKNIKIKKSKKSASKTTNAALKSKTKARHARKKKLLENMKLEKAQKLQEEKELLKAEKERVKAEKEKQKEEKEKLKLAKEQAKENEKNKD